MPKMSDVCSRCKQTYGDHAHLKDWCPTKGLYRTWSKQKFKKAKKRVVANGNRSSG